MGRMFLEGVPEICFVGSSKSSQSRVASQFADLPAELYEGHWGIPRDRMPQLRDAAFPKFLQGLKKSGVKVSLKKVPASQLKATQREFIAEKVEKMAQNGLSGLSSSPLIVSRDYHILDGHHRWAAKMSLDPSAEQAVFCVDLSTPALLVAASKYEGSTVDISKTAARAPGGLYGFTKRTQQDCEASIRKFSRKVSKIAKRLYAKDPESATFLAVHAKRAKSNSARVLMAAMKELGPKFASSQSTPKSTKQAGWGLYGFPSRTSELSIDACANVRKACGQIASDLHRRRANRHAKITGFFREHSKKARCRYARMILNSYPDESRKLASSSGMKRLAYYLNEDSPAYGTLDVRDMALIREHGDGFGVLASTDSLFWDWSHVRYSSSQAKRDMNNVLSRILQASKADHRYAAYDEGLTLDDYANIAKSADESISVDYESLGDEDYVEVTRSDNPVNFDVTKKALFDTFGAELEDFNASRIEAMVNQVVDPVGAEHALIRMGEMLDAEGVGSDHLESAVIPDYLFLNFGPDYMGKTIIYDVGESEWCLCSIHEFKATKGLE